MSTRPRVIRAWGLTSVEHLQLRSSVAERLSEWPGRVEKDPYAVYLVVPEG